MRLMDGRIWIESQLGEGSIFHILLSLCVPVTSGVSSTGAMSTED
jgi:signal transduction histidine kinase